VALLALVLLAVVGAGGWYAYRKSVGKPATVRCATTTNLTVAAAPEIAPAVTSVANGWNAQHTTVNGACVIIAVSAVAPSDVAAAIAAEAGASVSGLGRPNGDVTRPDVWIPDSSLWLARLGGASPKVALDGTSVASSPIVIAVPQPIAARLAASGRAPTWTQLLAQLSSGAIKPGITDPNSDASGLAALLAVAAAVGGTQPAGSAINGRGANAAEPGLSPTQAQAAIIAAMRALHAGESTLRADLMNRFPRSTDPATMARSLAAAPVPEQSMLAYNAARPPVPLAGLYLKPAPEALDYPYIRMPGLTATKADAAARFAGQLSGASWRDVLAAHQLRAADGTFGAAMPRVAGMPDGPFPATPAIPPAALDQTLSTWSAVTVPGRMLAVIDISGSMAARVPSAGGATRETVTLRAAGQGMALFDDSWAVGLWTFSTNLGPGKDYRELVPIAPLATNRTRMAGALATIKPIPNGATGLYDTVLAAYQTVQKDWDPTRINSVVVMTDGQNQDAHGLTLAQLLGALHRLADPKRPVEVIAIGIGTSVSKAELTKIAEATGGGAFITSDPSDIGEIFLKAISLRPGTAK
jgi:Mg-chelatase subunit ChlD